MKVFYSNSKINLWIPGPKSFDMKKYLSEKNALTVMTSLFCLVMAVIAITRQSMWEAVAFGLAFSFSIEILCHRAKEK
jgi:hypothetical protein